MLSVTKHRFSNHALCARIFVKMLNFCCCMAHLSSSILDDPYTFHCDNCFLLKEIRTCLGLFEWPIVHVEFVEFWTLNLLLVRSYLAEIIIVKCLIQGCKNMIRMRVESRLCGQPCCQLNLNHTVSNHLNVKHPLWVKRGLKAKSIGVFVSLKVRWILLH